jgi:hypothetical protein
MKGSIFSQIPQHLSTFVLTHYPVFLEYSWQASNIVMVVTCFTTIALGARAYKMDKWKGHVFIDGGEDEGFILGATVCFLSCSGKGFICGNVLKTSPSEAMVKVDNTATKIRDICDNNVYPNRKLCHIKSQSNFINGKRLVKTSELV